MNTTKITFKKSICTILTLILFLLSSIGILNILSNNLSVYAYTTDSYKNITIENANFDSSTKNEYPFAPTGYTLSDPSFNSVDADNLNVEAGVINISDTTVKPNPLSDDNYVLKLASTNNAHLGYVTNDAITMSADSFYSVSVDVYTSNTNGIACLYLIDDKEVVASMQGISSLDTWTTHTFFIKTAGETRNLKLGMYLNSEGEAYFDNLSANELNNAEYSNRLNRLPNGTKNETDLTIGSNVDERTINNNIFSQTDFEQGKSSAEYSYSTLEDYTNPETSDRTHTTAFRIKNNQATYAEYSTKGDFLRFEKNRVYRVTITAKALDLSGRATLALKETDENGFNLTGDDAKNNLSINITTNTSNAITNNYQTYSFYINSNPLLAKTYRLVVSLGDESNKTSGELYISGIKISNVTYSEFDSASESNKTNLATSSIPTDSEIMLNNGNFNGHKIADVTNPYPSTPLNWDVTLGSGTQHYGVVNTDEFDKINADEFINLVNPGAKEGSTLNNNVLMMYNESRDTLSYTSASKPLEKKTYHKFSVDVQTQNAPVTISLATKKDDKEVILKSITIDTEYTWKNVQLFIYTGFMKCDVYLKATLNSETHAYAYIDDAYFDYLLSSTDRTDATDYNNAEVSDTVLKVDLSNILSSDSNDDYAKSDFFTAENVTIGTINLDSPTLTSRVLAKAENLDAFRSIGGDKVLGVRALEPGYYTINSSVGYSLSANSYYKLTVSLYAQNLECADDLATALTLSLSGFDKNFNAVLVRENDKPGNIVEDGWKEYTFYLKPESDTTTYLTLSLGTAVNNVKGDVFIGGIEFVDEGISNFDGITDTDYSLVLETVNTNNDTDDGDDTDDTTNNNNAWIYAIPTILFALAIIIAIVGVIIRKIKFRKPKNSKKNKNEYDRARTVSKQVYMRKATTLRESKLRDLNKELETLTADRAKYEETYKRDLATLREMKIKRADSKEIAKLEKEMKKNQKLSSSIGLSIGRIEGDIEYIKTDAYLNSLVRKLENERFTEDENEDNADTDKNKENK